MPGFPPPLERLIEEFGRLPGIGTKTAERLAFYIVKADRRDAMGLALAIHDAKRRLRPCRVCFNFSGGETCEICADPGRDHGLVMVVEHPRDLAAFERTARYRGVYHVLLGRLSPHEGTGPEHISAQALRHRLEAGGVREVILATNPDAEGDMTARLLERLVAPTGVPLSGLARGLATGGSIEYAGTEMLADALQHRRTVVARADGGRP